MQASDYTTTDLPDYFMKFTSEDQTALEFLQEVQNNQKSQAYEPLRKFLIDHIHQLRRKRKIVNMGEHKLWRAGRYDQVEWRGYVAPSSPEEFAGYVNKIVAHMIHPLIEKKELQAINQYIFSVGNKSDGTLINLRRNPKTWELTQKAMAELKETLPASDELDFASEERVMAIHNAAEDLNLPKKINLDNAYAKLRASSIMTEPSNLQIM